MTTLMLALLCWVQAAGASAPASQWQAQPPLLHPRAAHAVAASDAGIFVLGGTGATGAPVTAVERFDGKSWTEETSLPSGGLNAPAAAAIGGKVYLIGGFFTTTNVPTADVHEYDAATKRWRKVAPLPSARGGHAALVHDGRIHVFGGGNSERTLDEHSVYDPGEDKWTVMPALSRSKGSPAAVSHGGEIYLIGGRSGPSDFGDVDVFSPRTGAWRKGTEIPPRGTAGAASLAGDIYVFGGESQAERRTLDAILRWRPEGRGGWEPAGRMSSARSFARAVSYRGAVYLVGGSESAGASHASRGSGTVEKFIPPSR